MTDFAHVTQAQQKAWSLGDMGKLSARTPPIYAETLCEELDLHPGDYVLDVAAGTGTTAMAALRRFCNVSATDFVPEHLVRARQLAAAEGLPLETHIADAQALPFDDGAFDVAVSTFGVMFAPDQRRAADELLRVVRPGGRIGVVAWCPDGVIGRYAATIGTYLPQPPGLRSPFEWGTEARVRELFGDSAREIRTVCRSAAFRYPSVRFAMEYFRAWYGPARVAFSALDEDSRTALDADMSAVWRAANRAVDGTLIADSTYLETIVVKS